MHPIGDCGLRTEQRNAETQRRGEKNVSFAWLSAAPLRLCASALELSRPKWQIGNPKTEMGAILLSR